MSTEQEWTPAEDATLIQLWHEGLSTRDIGDRLNRTKNSVVSRAHRLERRGLITARANPIPKNGGPRSVMAIRAAERRAIASGRPIPADALALPSKPEAPATVLEPVPGEPEPPPPAVPPRAFAPSGTCRFPMWGDNERPTHRYCGDPITLRRDGTPLAYCEHHAARCFVPAGPMRLRLKGVGAVSL